MTVVTGKAVGEVMRFLSHISPISLLISLLFFSHISPISSAFSSPSSFPHSPAQFPCLFFPIFLASSSRCFFMFPFFFLCVFPRFPLAWVVQKHVECPKNSTKVDNYVVLYTWPSTVGFLLLRCVCVYCITWIFVVAGAFFFLK